MKSRQQVEELWDAILMAATNMDGYEYVRCREKFIDFFCEEEYAPLVNTGTVQQECHDPDCGCHAIFHPDPYAELKAAQAAGKVIQWQRDDGEWISIQYMLHQEFPVSRYRIKPEEKKLVPFEEALAHYRKGGNARIPAWDKTTTLRRLIENGHGVWVSNETLGKVWELLP